MEGAMEEKKQNLFLRFGNRLFIALAFLLPVFFIPSAALPFAFGKGFFLFIAVFALTILFLFGVLKEGKVTIPKSYTLLGLFVVLISYVVSGFASAHQVISLLGQGFELDTAFFMLVAFLMTLLVPVAFRSKTSLFNIYIALLFSFFVAALYNIVRFMAPNALSFGVFSGSVANLVGSWTDLGFFAGFVTVLSLISLGVLESKGFWRLVLRIGLVAGVAFLAIVNFTTLWYIIAFFSLAFFLYSLSYARHHGGHERLATRASQVSWAPIGVLFISILFIFWGDKLGTSISNKLGISQLEARPSWATTLSIGKEALKAHPFVGVGPNMFVTEWLKQKPLEVNESVFWSLDFTAGVGTIPSVVVTLGGLGILAWLLFFALFAYEGVKAIMKLHGDAFAHYLAFSSFVGSLYFWLTAIFYTPSHAVYALAFLFTGIFVATMALEHAIPEKTLTFSNHPGKSFVGSLVTIVLIIGSATCIYISVQRFLSYYTFNNALMTYQKNNDLNGVETGVKRALMIEESDVFYRALSNIFLARLNQIASAQPVAGKEDEARTAFQSYLTGAVASGQAAVKLNPQNYQNYLTLAQTYAAVVPLKIQGVYEQAADTYKKAVSLNPTAPSLRLQEAQLEVAHGDNVKAREYIGEAINLKNNYTDAIFLLTQIEVGEGNTRKAIEAVTAGAIIAPTNPVLFFQLGLLYYNIQDYSNAEKALQRAIQLEPSYANAKYFLGLTEYRLGSLANATALFEDLKTSNPDNQEVNFILGNLKLGKSPFADVTPPLDSKPEKRKTPPVSEKKKVSATNVDSN
jgi:tetratricopeptide (TPR) repeat protein